MTFPGAGLSGLPRRISARRGRDGNQRRGAPAAGSWATVAGERDGRSHVAHGERRVGPKPPGGRPSAGNAVRPLGSAKRPDAHRRSVGFPSGGELHAGDGASRGVGSDRRRARRWHDERGDARRRRGIARGERAARADHHPRGCRHMEEPRASGRGGSARWTLRWPLSSESVPGAISDSRTTRTSSREVRPIPIPGVRLGRPLVNWTARGATPPTPRRPWRERRQHPARGRPPLGAVRAAAGRSGRASASSASSASAYRQDTDRCQRRRSLPR